jgi:hypothetical protein
MPTANSRDEGMRNRALAGDLSVTPIGALLAAEESRDGLQLVLAAARQSVLGVGAAGKKKGIVTIPRMNLAVNMLRIRMNQPISLKAVKAVADIKGPVPVAEHIDGWKRHSVAHRLGIVIDHALGGSGCSLLDGGIYHDRSDRNELHLAVTVGITSCIHGSKLR